MRTPATNFEALLGQARDCGLTQEFATAYEINVALDEADCCGGGGSGDFGYISNLSIYVPNEEPLPEQYYQLCNNVSTFYIRGNINSVSFPKGTLTYVFWLSSTFYGCSKLTSATFPEGALTNVTYMYQTFESCTSLSSVTLQEGALTQVFQMPYIFNRCSSLTSFIFPNGALTQVLVMNGTFSNCKSLISVVFPEGALTQVTNMAATFYNCTSLQDLTIYSLPNINLTNICFSTCPSLTLSSLQNILNALPTTTSGYKCTIGTTNLAKLSETDIQIATDKGWTLN